MSRRKRAEKKEKGTRKEEKLGDIEEVPQISKERIVLGVGIVFILVGTLLTVFALQRPACAPAYSAAQAQEIGEKAAKWVEDWLKSRGASVKVSLESAGWSHGLVEVNITISGPQGTATYTSYVSPDGKVFFPQGLEMAPVKTFLQEVPKTEKPKVELFVMSYCPYGLQAEKAMIPVLDLLGKRIDFTVRFVDYAMHGEKEVWENARQYCIQHRVAPDKYIAYLRCFVQEGTAEKCMKEAGIDPAAVDACMSDLNREYNIAGILADKTSWNGPFPPFPLDTSLNEKYGVRGSPTLVINGVTMQATPRNPEALKELICSAFTSPPPECSVTLSSQNASPGIGPIEGGESASAGSCG